MAGRAKNAGHFLLDLEDFLREGAAAGFGPEEVDAGGKITGGPFEYPAIMGWKPHCEF
jgi:hypothetical protein